MAANTLGKRDVAARFSASVGATALLEMLPQRRRLLVLNYHRIGDPSQTPYDSGVFSTGVEGFDEQIGYLKRHFHMTDLEEALEEKGKPSRGTSVLVTFDDGYLDNYQAAFPVLRSHGVRAAFFLPTAFVGTGDVPWWDAVAYIVKHSVQRKFTLQYPETSDYDLDREGRQKAIDRILVACKRNDVDTDRLIAELSRVCECARPAAGAERCFMDWNEAREMNTAGMAFGSHTHTHPILAKLTPEDQYEELSRSREIMERELGGPVRTLAYPVGLPSTFSDSTAEVAERAGYSAAFSFYGGTNEPGQFARFDIRRVAFADPTPERMRLQSALMAVTGSYWF